MHIARDTWKDAHPHQSLKSTPKPQKDITSHQWEWLVSKIKKLISVGEDTEIREPSYTSGGIANW